jgi:hypothetical protein
MVTIKEPPPLATASKSPEINQGEQEDKEFLE